MNLFKMQPTFTVDVPISAEDAIGRIRKVIKQAEPGVNTISAGQCVEFRIDPPQQRFWSPHLSVQLNDTDSGSQLYGRFSPRPEIWTMFMAIYGVVSSLMFAAAIYGYVQWFLGEQPWALIIVPSGILIILGLHLASIVGQSLSADQMSQLRERLDRTLKTALHDVSNDGVAELDRQSGARLD